MFAGFLSLNFKFDAAGVVDFLINNQVLDPVSLRQKKFH